MTPPLRLNRRTPEGRLLERIFNHTPEHRKILERAASELRSQAPIVPADDQYPIAPLERLPRLKSRSIEREPALARLTSKQLNTALLQILAGLVLRSRHSYRELERVLHLGHGTIGNLFREKTELRLHHVEAIGKIYGLSLEQLLLQALGYTAPPAKSQIGQNEILAQLVADKVVAALKKDQTQPEDRCIHTPAPPLPRSRFQQR